MARFDEGKHPRDEDGKFTEKGAGKGSTSRDTARTVAETGGDLAGNLLGGAKGDKFATKAFDSALSRWGITTSTRFTRYAIPTLRLASRLVLGGMAATGVGSLAAGAALLGVDAYYGFRDWQRSREGAEAR